MDMKYIENNAERIMIEIFSKISIGNNISFEGYFAAEQLIDKDFSPCFIGFNRTEIYIIKINEKLEQMDTIIVNNYNITKIEKKNIFLSKNFYIIIDCETIMKFIITPSLNFIARQRAYIDKFIDLYQIKSA